MRTVYHGHFGAEGNTERRIAKVICASWLVSDATPKAPKTLWKQTGMCFLRVTFFGLKGKSKGQPHFLGPLEQRDTHMAVPFTLQPVRPFLHGGVEQPSHLLVLPTLMQNQT